MISRYNSPTVLLVEEAGSDDSPKSWLEDIGYNVREAANVAEAFDEIMDFTLEHRPSLILLNSNVSLVERTKTMNSLHELADVHELPVVALALHDETSKTEASENFLQAKNLDSLKPLIASLLSNSLHSRVAA